MGWTGTRNDGSTTKDFLTREFNGPTGKVLDIAMKAGVAYIAYQRLNDDGSPKFTVGIVCLMRRSRGEIAYKDMDEGMGPLASRCPERILKLLSPVDDIYPDSGSMREWAMAWRGRCQRSNAVEAAGTSRRYLAGGEA